VEQGTWKRKGKVPDAVVGEVIRERGSRKVIRGQDEEKEV